MNIRHEQQADFKQIYAVNEAAFERHEEAKLVNLLRDKVAGCLSLVALESDEVVGHIMFSPVCIDGVTGKLFYGLAPMAVLPSYQNKGIGSSLVEAGLDECRKLGGAGVFVLGHPNYYPRFGFTSSSQFNIKSEYDVPEDVFMALELQTDSLDKLNGIVKYNEVFACV